MQAVVLAVLALGGMHRAAGHHLHHRAGAGEQGAPVHLVQRAQGGDGVADALVVFGCLGLLPRLHAVAVGQVQGQPGLQQAGLGGGQVVCALLQLQQEGIGRATPGQACQLGIQHAVLQAVGPLVLWPVQPLVGGVARHLQQGGALGQAAQVLQQHHAQGAGQGPQLGQGQGAGLLVGAQIGVQQLQVQAGIGVGHPGPGHAVDARQAGQRFVAQARQQAEEIARQAQPHLLQLFVQQVGVVQQPMAGRAQVQALARLLLQQQPGPAQGVDVVLQTRKERGRGVAGTVHLVGGGQAVAVLREARQAEQHGADRRLWRAGAAVQGRQQIVARVLDGAGLRWRAHRLTRCRPAAARPRR